MLLRFVDLVLYGHFWIALAAWLMQAQTQLLYFGYWQWSAFDGFVAAGTLVIYAIHRLVAMQLQEQPVYAGRFKIMRAYQHHIVGYALIAAGVGAWFFFQLDFSLQLTLLLPCLVALAYVLPMFKGRRLRDFPYLKIFLIAFSWAWITVVGPVIQGGGEWDSTVAWLALERAAFIFAITIPFDIRDLVLDQLGKVSTLPGRFGVARAKRIAYLSLGIMFLAIMANGVGGFYSWPVVMALIASGLIAAGLVFHAHAQRHDYYYTGALDGTMILQALLVWMASGLSSVNFPLEW